MNNIGFTVKFLLRRRLAHLRSLIVNEDDKLLFDDVSRCLVAGANRSAFITTWLCAAASIRSKLEKVSPRDSQIGKELGGIEEDEKSGNPIDQRLLHAAKKFGMIGDVDYESLEYIRTRRNIYAHPRRAAPTPDEVLGALGTVVRSLLSKPPLLRYGYASDIIRGVFEERHYLDDVKDRVVEFGRRFANRIDPQIHSWVFQKSIKRLDEIWDDNNLATIRLRGVAFLHGFLLETRGEISQDDWKVIQNTRSYSKATPIALSNPEIWVDLPVQAREIIVGYLTEAIRQEIMSSLSTSSLAGPLPSQAFDAIKLLRDSGVLDNREEERFLNALNNAPFSRLVQYGVHLNNWFDRVIEALKSHDWYVQNPAVDAIEVVGPEQIGSLPENSKEILGRNILQSAEGRSNSARDLLSSIEVNPTVWPLDFLKGIVFECFLHESGVHRFKNRTLPQVMGIVCRFSRPEALSILDELISSLASSEPKNNQIWSPEYEHTIDIINQINEDLEFYCDQPSDTTISERFSQLVDVLRQLNESNAG